MTRYSDENDGYSYIYTMIDSFSKFAWVAAAHTKTASECAKILKKIFLTEGKWDIFHSDNGGEFVNDQVQSLLRNLGIQEIHGRPYHPQSQGQMKRYNRTLKSKIRKTVDPHSFRWIDKINGIVFYYNNTVHNATKQKPFLLFRGYDQKIHDNDYNDTNDFRQNARIRLIEYAETYRREVTLISNESLTVGDQVKVLRRYNIANARRPAPLASIYHQDNFQIETVLHDVLIFINLRN